MNKKKLECPICKAQHELILAPTKMVYRCPSCERMVRSIPPQKIETPKPKSETERVTKQVESPQEIPEEVAKEVKKASDEALKKKSTTKKKTSRKKKTSTKKKSQ